VRFPLFLIRPANRRQWWTLFSVATALPAIVLAILALRAVRLVQLEVQQRASQEHDQATRAVDGFLDRELNAGGAIAGAIQFSVRPDVAILPADRLYFGGLADPPAEARRALAESTLDLVEQARAAPLQSATAMFARIASREPALRDWADLSTAVLRKDQKRIESRHWPESNGLTPTGLPVALLAAATSRDTAMIRHTLERLRTGAWWLSYEERLFHDAELSRALSATGAKVEADPRLAELAHLGPALVRAAPRLLAGDSRIYAGGGGKAYLLIAPDPERGQAIPADRIAATFGSQLAAALGDTAEYTTLRHPLSGAALWRAAREPKPFSSHRPLTAVPGWELAFSGAASEKTLRGQQTLWYFYIAVLLLTLGSGLLLTVRVVHREVELSQRQSEFVAAVTHEFKSPITSMRLLLERLTSRRVAAESADEYYAAIHFETSRLDRLVTRLLESQRVQSGKRTYTFESCSLNQLVERSVSKFRAQADAKEIQVDLDMPATPVSVVADEVAIAAAIDNLLDNAIRYSPQRTAVSVSLSRVGPDAVLVLRDRGIGIDESDLPHIFDRFYRGRRGDRYNVRGTGLGLALVKAAADAHGGSVEVTSTPGEGSSFRLRLPLDMTNESE
jgi:signal transduction histidine kinase